MKAVVRLSDKPKDFDFLDVQSPALCAGMVLVKVAYAGICGSDLHIYQGYEQGLPENVHGHEFSGVIAGLGQGVGGWNIGDKVTVEHTFSTCERCAYCRGGQYHLCAGRQSLGFTKQGAFAEYVLVFPQYLHKLPKNLGLKAAALTEPLACIIHAIEKVPHSPASTALVAGPGAMGLLCGLVMQAYGMAVHIFGAAEDKERLLLANELGMQVVTAESAAQRGYSLAADCSGSQGGVAACIGALNKGGTLLQVGIATKALLLPYEQIVYKELRIQGTFCHVYGDWEKALALQGGGLLDVLPLVTSVVPLKFWQKAFEDLLEKKGIKTLFAVSNLEE